MDIKDRLAEILSLRDEVCRDLLKPSALKAGAGVSNSLDEPGEDPDLTELSGADEDAEGAYLDALCLLLDMRRSVKLAIRRLPAGEAELKERGESCLIRIGRLAELIDQERIDLIKKQREIDADIKRILESEDRHLWPEIQRSYHERGVLAGDLKDYYMFIVSASNAGIREAHMLAAYHFYAEAGDNGQALQRLRMAYDAYEKLPAYAAREIVHDIAQMLSRGAAFTEEMQRLIDGVVSQGYAVTRTGEGTLEWDGERP